MNRRNFLTRSGLALGALVVGAEALEAMERLTHVRKSFPSATVAPRIWGDGMHDDTAAIQYAIDEAARRGVPFVLPYGSYRLASAPVVLRGTVRMTDSYFDARKPFPTNAPAFIVPDDSKRLHFSWNTVVTR